MKHPILKTIIDKSPHLSWINDGTIFLTLHGSRAYGLDTPESDYDYRGICVASKEYYIGFSKVFEQAELKDPDTTIFDIRKFLKLANQGNPNCLEILFTEAGDHFIVSDLGQKLLDNRNELLSKQLKERYIGYSRSQAHRIRGHRRWLLNPLSAPPTRQELGLPEKPQIDKNQFDVIKSLIAKKLDQWNPDFEPFSESQKIYLQGKVSDILAELKISVDDKWLAAAKTIGLNDNVIAIIKQEKEYENKLEDWNNYQRWKKNRNPKRAAMEAKFGYDLKHGSTLVRLLRLGKEILETSKVQVKRTHDREELLAIKNGAWTYQQLVDYADKVEAEIKIAYENSKLPNQPNIKLLDKLSCDIIETHLGR